MRHLGRALRTMGRALVLLAGGGLLGVAVNAVRPHGVALFAPVRAQAENGTAACGATPPMGAGELVPIECREAASLLGRRDVVFVDLRPAASYVQGHITGACHLDSSLPGPPATVALREASTVVLYGAASDGLSCEPIRAAAGALHREGCRDVRVLAGGFEAWVQANQPAASGACEECGAKAASPAFTPTASLSAGRGT